MKNKFFNFFKIILTLYIFLCILLYFFQVNLIFFPHKLHKNYNYEFKEKFEEINIKTKDGKKLNTLLFKAKQSKGVIFYLHGNAGSLCTWGELAKTYTHLNYDVFMIDYRGFGKSEGKITSENQLYEDNQTAYQECLKRYNEDKIIILGYSIGTGLASKLASTNQPKMLILQAPYYNLSDLIKRRFLIIPTFILKYKFNTNEYLKNCEMPIVLFHGKNDEVIDYQSSLKLQNEFKKQDTLIILKNQGHNDITNNLQYQKELKKILLKID